MNNNNELAGVIKTWLWEYLVDQSNFESSDDIWYEKSQRIPGNKDYITFYFTDYRYLTLVANVSLTETNQATSDFKFCRLAVSYHGENAIDKVNEMADLIRSYGAAREFLNESNVNSEIDNILDISSLVADNNIQESAQLDLFVQFTVSKTKEFPNGTDYVEAIEVDSQLFE